MIRTARLRTVLAASVALSATLSLGLLASAAAPMFFPDDPLWVETDTQDASALEMLEVDLTTDLAYNFLQGFRGSRDVRAANVNTVDEVPRFMRNLSAHRNISLLGLLPGLVFDVRRDFTLYSIRRNNEVDLRLIRQRIDRERITFRISFTQGIHEVRNIPTIINAGAVCKRRHRSSIDTR